MDRWLPKGAPPPPQSDGAFERFLTAAIATIITIMFSWRLLDKINDEDREDELAEEERRRRLGLSTFLSSPKTTAAPTFGGEGAARNKTPDITPTTQLYSAGKLDALNQRVLALTENMGRGRLSSGIGYQTTTLKPVIRIPVDLPLDGEEEEEEEEEIGGESPNESIYRPVWGNTVHPQVRSQRKGIPVKLESKHAGECFDQRADRYEVDRQHDSSFESNTVTDGTASSTETLLVHSQLDSEPEHSSSETDQFVDSSAEELGGDGQHSHYQHRQLQLNVSTDSSSGGANSSKEEYRNILDDDNYQPYRDSYRDGDDKYSDRDSDEEFLGISDGLDTDYAHDDIQPRELDSDEELFCCSVLEPIIEEDSDEITTSSDSTNSSRSGKACYESRHREHEYDLEYEERKHGLISDRGQYQIRSRGLDEHDSVRLSSSLSSGVSNQQHVLLGSRPSTAVPSPRRPLASPHLPGRTRDLESSRLNDVNTASATGPDDQGDTGRGGDDGVRTHTLGEERYYGGIDERLSVSQPPFQETDLDASDSYEDNTNFPSEEDYVRYIRSYGSSVDRLTGKLNRPVRRDNLGPFPHSQPPIDSVSEGITDTTKRTFPASLTGHHADQVVPDKFTRTLTEDSNSESDESAQTVITRQTSADSGDSPVHGPTLLTLRPGPVKTKRPLSDGFAYAIKKLKGEEDKEEAYFRDRYVSEGGAPAFGEEGREQDDEDDYGREDNNNKYDLRAYKSYAALDSAGLSSPEHARKVTAHSTVLTLSGAKWDIPEIRDENSPSARDSNEDREFDQQEESTSTVTIDSEETFLPCDSVDNQNVQSDELKHPGDFKFVYSQFSREDNNDSEIMDTNEYWSAMADESLGSRTREHEDSEEWEERIVEETFVVPMTPERAILRTLQSVKELLDKRSEIRRHRALGLNVEETSEGLDDECQSTCTSTMIEVDGYGAAGFETYDAVEEDFPEQSDALVSRPLTNVDIKSNLGFHLNLDEYKTDEYSTESGWPIVRLIEKERVYIDEDGHDEHQVAVTIVDSGEQKLRDVHSDEEMETNIDDVEDSHDDEEGSRQNDADESDDESEEDDEEEEEGETDEESDEEKSESTNSDDDDKEIDDKKKEEKFAFVECKDEKLVAPFASLETPVLDKRTHSQRTYLEQEGFAKLDFGDTKSPTVTQRSKPDFKTPESASTPDSYTPVVRAEMRAMSPPPIEIFTPKQQHSEVLFSPARKSTPPSYEISKHSSSSTITVSKTVQLHSISGFETEPKKLIDFDQPCDPFDDFNTFLSGIPAASESVIEEDYDSFVRHIAEKDEAVEILEQDSLKTPLSAAGILSGNLASPYKKQDVFSFPSKEQVRPVPLARKHSLRDKKPEVKEEETEVTGESDVKKAKLKRTSTAQSEEDFGLARRSSVGDEESTGVMNRSFEESSSYSFALERYDSEPGVSRSLSRESLLRTTSREGLESPTQDMRLLAETPTRHFVPSRPLSGVSLEPALDVVLEVPIPPQDSFRTGSSSSAEPTTPATPSSVAHVESSPVVISLPVAPLPTVSKTPSSSTSTEKLLATPTKLEPSPVVSPPPPPTISKTPTKTVTEKAAATPTKLETSPVVTTPPPPTISKTPTKPITEKSAAAPNKPEPSPVVTPPTVKWTRVIPGSSFVDEKLSPNSGVNIAEEVQKKLPDTPERKLITTMTSPKLERPDLMELEFADAEEDGPELFSPSLSIDRMEIKIEESPKIRPVLENNVLKFSVDEKLEAADSQKSEESEDTEESESEYSDESDTSEEYEEEEEEELVSDKVSEENKANVDNNDNLVRENQDKEKEAVVEKRQEESLQVEHLSHSIDSVDSTMPQDTTSASVATSPGTLSSDSAATRSMTLPLTAPFRGMAWAHSQFGQAPAKPRTMKEIKKKFKPYKSVLTQGPPPTTPTTPPSPKITPFVLPEHLLTPSRLKIIQSRNRFLSEQNLNGDEFSGEFEARKEALMQNAAAPSETAPSTPAKERKYTPKNLSTSSKYRSQEQLEKIMNMINLTRKSESNLHTAHTKCLHSDCIFTEKGRRDIMDKALSIDNIHSDLYSQLQKLNAKDYLDSRGMGDAFFPETNSDLFDLTFPFQDDRRQVLDRPASMSELRHASDYTTISGSGGGLFDTPTSRSGKNRFANRQYKKSKSLCTLETNIDDDHFASSPTDDNLQRVPSVHELRISKSLQKLNVPNWYKQSSLSKSGSCLLKYGSSSTMSSWQMSPSLISSPCTTPSAMSNVVIKTRVQPPTSARNLRSPRYPSKSAPTTPSFANQSFENGSKPTTPTPVKLPSEQLRSKEKPKSLMPIPIVPFDKIRAMFEKKKEEAPPPKRGESPSSPTSPVPKPQVQESLPSPKKIGINGNAEEDELYDDVVPKVIVSPTDPNVKSILKRPGQEKRYSDIVESPEPEEEPIILRPVPTRPSEAAPTLTLPSAPVIMKPPEVVLVKEEEPVIKPPSETPKATLEDKPVIRQKPIPPPRPKSSEIKPITEVPVKKPEEVKDIQKSQTKPVDVKDPTPPTKPKGFSFFKSLRSSSSSSSEDVKTRKSPISPSKNLSPDSSYESDKFPASPAIRISPTDRKSPPSINVSTVPVTKEEPKPTILDKPLSAPVLPKAEMQRTRSPDLIQETNIDDSFEDPPSPRHETAPERTQSPPQSPPPQVSEPEKKRSWFAKPKLSKSKSPTEVEKSLPKSKLKVSELQSKFEVPEFAQEPRRLTSSRTSSVHNESFASNESEGREDKTRSPVVQPDYSAANVQLRSPVKETDLDSSIQSNSSRPSIRSRDLGVDYSRLQRKPSDSDSSFARDSEKRDSDRSREEKPVTRELDMEKDSSFSSRDEDRHNDSSDKDYDRDYDRRESDRRDRDYDRRDVDRRDRDYDRRDVDRRDRDFDRRDVDRRDRDFDRRDVDRRDRDYDRRDVDRRDRDYDRRESDRRDRDNDRRESDRRDRDNDRRDRDYDRSDMDYDRRDVSSRDRDYDRRDRDNDRRDRNSVIRDRDGERSKRNSDSLDRRRPERQEPTRDRHQDFDTSRASSRDMDTSRDSRTGLRRPSDNDDTPKLRVGQSQESLRSAGRTWQPKPRGSRSSVSPQARDISPTKPVDSNGTSSKPSPYRYPVAGSAFSASKPNTAAGLNTPPLSRHDGKSQSSPTEAGKSLKETTV